MGNLEPVTRRPCIIGLLALALAGCSDSVGRVPACPEVHEAAHEVATEAVEHLEAARGRRRLQVAESCASIATALTGAPVEVPRPLTHAHAEELCSAALAAIEHRLELAELSAELLVFGGCERDEPGEDACLSDCGASSTCDPSCAAWAVFRAGCVDPELAVSSTDASLSAAIAEHFPPILALDLFVANHYGDGMDALDPALAALVADLGRAPGCLDRRAHAEALRERSELAFGELIDLLSWVRIPRMSIEP